MDKDISFFSIIIPTLNEEKYLPNLLTDLSKQIFRNFEVIIVDGYSKDLTVAKALKFKEKLPQLSILQSKKRNVSVQRNMGGDKAEGLWLIFMDADDRIPEYFLEGVKYKTILTKPDAFTCWSEVDSKSTADRAIPTVHNLVLDVSLAIDNPTAYGALMGVKKAVFKKLKGFKPKFGFAEDSEFVVRIHKAGYSFQVFHDPKFIYSLRRYRERGTLDTLRRTAKLHLMNFAKIPVNQKKEYPMGGLVTGEKGGNGLTFLSFQEKLRKLGKNKKIKKFLKSFITDLKKTPPSKAGMN